MSAASVTDNTFPSFDPKCLQPGDILLMMGTAPLSAVIAWASDSIYSHAALVADDSDLIEASLSGVRRYGLSERFQDRANFHYIDAYRPLARDGSAITADQVSAVVARADHYLRTPYPADQLAQLGLIFAARGKFPTDPEARLLTRMVLEHAVSNDPSHVVCTELVYRSFNECGIDPQGCLTPRIVIQPRVDTPFPDIDWKALYEEVAPLLQSRTAQPSLGGTQDVAEEELQALAAAVRARHQGLRATVQPAAAVPADSTGLELPDPNPKLISPLDLATTPSHRTLGRVMAS